MNKYLLPCECGDSLPIDSTQAGQTLTCSCGRALEVPTMRAIRQLEPYELPEKPPRKLQWNAAAGSVFTAGILVTTLGLAVAGFGYYNWSHHQRPPLPQVYIDSYVLDVEDATAADMLEKWQQTVDMDLAPYETSPEVVSRRTAKLFAPFIYVGLVIVGAGVLTGLSALFFRRRV